MTIAQIRNRETQHAEHAGGRGDGKVQRFTISSRMKQPGRGGWRMRVTNHFSFVIVLKFDVAHGRVIDDRVCGQFDGRITS